MTLQRYFTPSASFAHPFCRTGSYDITEYFEGGRLERVLNSTGMGGVVKEVGNSRGLIGGIYRWYKILSPKIELEVDSVGMFLNLIHTGNAMILQVQEAVS